MSDVILKVQNLSKQYRLGNVGTGTMSHDLNRWWHKIRGKEDPYLKIGETNDRSKKVESDYAWALRNINFEVKRGEVLGIIGKNGAGKSTLLKILSRVTSPTTGEIKSKGRIASLLEVGTGFHPELTGRENIYLNGAILGMTKSEITSKEQEIIEFSGCERYIDTPVKRYSSGMRVRLAFAVAAHLEPDILVVDEVLAVGDAEFQKKAIGKMQDISKGEGRTVLFVSHDLFSISKLCERLIVLHNGEIAFEGKVYDGISYYRNLNYQHLVKSTNGIYNLLNHKANNNSFTIHEVMVFNDKNLSSSINVNANISFKLKIEVKRDVIKPEIGFVMKDSLENSFVGLNNLHLDTELKIKKGISFFTIEINQFPLILNEGVIIDFFLGDSLNTDYLCMLNAIKLDVNTDYVYDSSKKIDLKFNKVAFNKINIYENDL